MHNLPGTTPPPATTGIEEEEIRMEIKALKGLVLNRSVSSRRLIHNCSHAHCDRRRLLLQENVHSGYCSALECTNTVTRRCLTFVTSPINIQSRCRWGVLFVEISINEAISYALQLRGGGHPIMHVHPCQET